MTGIELIIAYTIMNKIQCADWARLDHLNSGMWDTTNRFLWSVCLSMNSGVWAVRRVRSPGIEWRMPIGMVTQKPFGNVWVNILVTEKTTIP